MMRSLIAAALLAAPLAVQAENDEAPLSGRTLNGHPFLPMSSVVQPFVNTEFQSFTAAGTATVNYDAGDLRANNLQDPTENFSLGYMSTGVGAQIGIADLVAVRLALDGSIFS